MGAGASRVGYRVKVRRPDGEFTVERQAYYETQRRRMVARQVYGFEPVVVTPCRLLVLDYADLKTVSDSRASGSEEGGGDDGDSVRPAVGVFAGGDDDGVEEFVAEPVS